MLILADVAENLLAGALAWAVGWQEVLVIIVIVLILFGGRKIPELAKGLGKGLREFKKEMRGVREDFSEAIDNAEEEEEYTPPRRKKRRKKRRIEPAETAEEPGEDDDAETDPAEEPKTGSSKA